MDSSPSEAGPRREASYLRLHHVTVFVRDVDRSLRFFVDRLGFTLAVDQAFEGGGRWVAVAPPDGAAILALVAPDPDGEAYALVGRARDVTFVAEDVPARYREWSERGVAFHHAPRAPEWGGVMTSFEDPDGNTYALVGYDSLIRQLDEQRREAAERLEAERRAARELEIAKEVQARLFPQARPPMRTLDYAGVCLQARQVGGDYYDFLNLGSGRLGLVIGDVAGKGIAAALMMANLQASLRGQCALAADLPRLLRSVNRHFFENTTDNAYATLFFADYDDAERRLRYANCGHLAGLVLRAGGALERLEPTCTVLGLFEAWEYAAGDCVLSPGDVLALYTDGVTEAFGEGGEEFGETRLVEALGRQPGASSRELLEILVEEVRRFSPHEQHDDLTLIVARCGG